MKAEKREINIQKIQKGDIWLQYSWGLVGFLIRIATQSPVNHAGLITKYGFMIHAQFRGLVKEKYSSYLCRRSLKITIVRIKDSLFNSDSEKDEFIDIALTKAEAMKNEGLGYGFRLIFQMVWRALLRMLGLWRVKKVKNLLDQRRVEIICSQFVDDVWDELERRKEIDLFRTTIHPREVTPKDILKSPHIEYVTGWYYPDCFER